LFLAAVVVVVVGDVVVVVLVVVVVVVVVVIVAVVGLSLSQPSSASSDSYKEIARKFRYLFPRDRID
jgi:flagellar basal body-associated protein FliL